MPEPVIDPADVNLLEDEPKWHTWFYQEDAKATPIQFEFGMPITRREAHDRICTQLGVDALDQEKGYLEHDAPPKTPPLYVSTETSSTPEPAPTEPEPEPTDPAPF